MSELQPLPVRILGVRIAKRALDGNSESGLVATVDLTVPGFTLLACGLYRQRNGTMMIAPPRSDRYDGVASGVRFDSEPMRQAMVHAACNAARAFGASVDPVEPAAT